MVLQLIDRWREANAQRNWSVLWHNGNEALLMLANRSKDAWILVAIAAITLASLARPKAGIGKCKGVRVTSHQVSCRKPPN